MKRYIISVFALLIVLFLPNSRLIAAEKVILQLRWHHGFQFAGYYMAKVKGFYRNKGLEVEFREGGIGISQYDNVINGQAQFGVSGSELIIEYLNGQPLRAVAVIFQHSPYALMVRKNSGYNNPQQLAGKKIYMALTLRTAEIQAMLLQEGVNLKQIIRVNALKMKPNFDNPDIDAFSAYITNEPYLMEKAGIPVRLIRPINYGIDFYGDCLFTSNDYIREKPQVVEAFRKASLQGWEYAFNHPQETIEQIWKKYNTENHSKSHLTYEYETIRDLVLPDHIPLGLQNPSRWERIAKTYASLGMASVVKNSLDFIYDPVMIREKKLEQFKVFALSGIASLVIAIGLFFLWTWSLRRQVAAKTTKLKTEIGVRKEAEQQLREREHQLTEISNQIPGMIYQFVQHDDGSYSVPFVSKKIYEYSGYQPEEVIKNSNLLFEPVHPEDIEMIQQKIQRSYETMSEYNVEHRLISPDGSIRWFYAHSVPFRLENGNVLWNGLSIDITERKKTEKTIQNIYKRLSESTQIMEAVLQHTHVMATFLDPEFNFIWVNSAFADTFGHAPSFFPGKNHFALYPHKENQAVFQNAVDTGKPFFASASPFEFSDQPKRGITYWDWSLIPVKDGEKNVTGLVFTLVEVTDQNTDRMHLKERERQYRALVETTKAVAWELDLETSQFNYMSPRIFDLTGYEPEMWYGFDFWAQVIHPDDREWAVRFCQTETEKGKDHEFEYRMITAVGETIWIRDMCTVVLKEGNPDLLRGYFLDISAHKQSEAALRQSQAMLHAALDSMTDAVFISDAEGRFIEFNKAFATFHRLKDKKECLSALEEWTTLLEVYLPDGTLAPLSMWAVSRALQGETGIGVEYSLRRKDTGETWVGRYNFAPIYDSDGRIKGSVVVGCDITERKQAEEKHIATTERLNLATRSARLGIWDWDITNNNLSWDDEMYRLYGLKLDEFPNVYEAWLKSVHPDDRDENDKISAAARRGEKEYDTEFRIIRPDGEIRHLKALGQVFRDSDGEPLRMIGINYDITERKEMEARIQQSQKMEAIGNLAGGIAHDFNNILFPIVGMSELLLEDLPPDSQEHQYVEEIFIAGKRGGDLVKQILAFSRQSELKKIPIRIQKILKEVMKLSRSTIPSNIRIHTDIQDDCGLVLAEPTKIHQIAMNLITNAYHAVETKNGEISVQLKETTLGVEELADPNLVPGRYAKLTISDTGSGIDPVIMDKIFEPYFTTKEQGKGTGLGLSVVYAIIQEHHGEIEVNSKMGKGTNFNVFLPIMEKTAKSVTVENAENYPSGTEHILLVDDEASIVRLEIQIFKRLGYKVTSCTSSAEALEAFSADPSGFDLVVSDMTMPNLTGDQLARELIAVRQDIPIIICTGFNERIDQNKADAIGIKGFLMKPIVRSEIAEMVRKVLDDAKIRTQQ